MDILTRFEYHLKIVPGAVATFRRVTATTRAAFYQEQAKYRAQIRQIQRQRKPLDDAYQKAIAAAKAAALVEVDRIIEAEKIDRAEAEKRVPLEVKFPDHEFAEWADLMDQQSSVERDAMKLSMLRSVLVGVSGYTFEGLVPSVEEFLAEAPVEVTDELAAVADEIAGLGATERGESPWPGISPPVEAGPKTSTVANDAESSQAAAA